MGFVWDEVKEELFRFECDTLVSASAGTGKTAALVELYRRIIEGHTALGSGITPHNILALTFTRKAAGEMRERLRETMLSELRRGTGNASYADLLGMLSDAGISTFDSFCMRLLREHHFEAGLPPDLSLLPEDEARRLLMDSTVSVMRRKLSESWKGVFLLLENNSFEQLKTDMYNISRASEVICGPRPDFQAEKEALPDRMHAKLDASIAILEELLLDPQLKDNFRVKLEDLVQHIRVFGAPAKRPAPETPRREGMAYFEAAPNGLVHKFKKIHSNSWPKEAKETRKLLLSHLLEAQAAFERIFAIDEAEAAFDMAVMIRNQYDEAKTAMNMLDFSDLLKKSIELLSLNREIRKEWQSRFDVIMVDEFQDTNRIQLRLIKLLSRDDDFVAAGARRTRLLFVGDRKQSIYRFRGAEVSVFRQIESEWQSRKDAKILHFRRNFRSNARLLQFSNALFGSLLNDGAQDYQSSYTSEDDLLPGLEFSGNDTPVELLRVNKSVLRKKEDKLPAEAQALAERLREIVLEEKLQIGPPESLRSATFEDIAVLVRTKNVMPAFEQAFRRVGLPFTVFDGSGLFERSEIMDMIAAARILVEPWNQIALLTVLRSPAVHLTDNAVFRLMHACKSDSVGLESLLQGREICAELCGKAAVSGAQLTRLLHFTDVYSDLSRRRRLMPASEIFEELLERLDLEAAAAGGAESLRATANQRKFLRMLREIETRESSGDFCTVLRRIELMQSDPRSVSEAPQSACGIQLMTIHQSKGLEFPLVVLPAVEIKAGAFRGRLLADGKAGVIAKTRTKLDADPFQEMKELHKSMELAEERRIYYVAATRAKDRLIIGCSISDSKSKSSRGDSGEEGESAAVNLSDEIEKAAALCALPLRISDIDGESSTSPVRSAATFEKAPSVEYMAHLCAEAQARPPRPSMLGTFSVSMLNDFKTCERRYHLRRMLERSTNLWIEAPYADESNPAGASMGLLVHRFLESIPPGSVPSSELISAFFVEASTKNETACARAVHDLEHFFASEWYADLARRSTAEGVRLHREMPFIAELDLSDGRRVRLKGRVDLLVETPHGELHLIDYKYASSGTQHADDYIMQVAVYARALKQAWRGRPVNAEIVYLAGRGEVRRIEGDSPEAQAACERFEQALVMAHARSALPYSEWRICDAENCRADACRFMKLCGIDFEEKGKISPP